jgi:hypothetical protein
MTTKTEVINLSAWQEFPDCVQSISRRIKANKDTGTTGLLFRGQSDADWQLETTLERFSPDYVDVFAYAKLMKRAQPEIQAYTPGQRWPEIQFEEYKQWSRDFEGASLGHFPHYEFMVYLRHHGYPSPLLDWSRSPYVAAFFASRPIAMRNERCAIYVYCADTGHGHSGGSGGPNLITLSHYVSGHRRHFAQQCEYTICALFSDRWYYHPHEKGFEMQWRSEQDKLWKITIPTSERQKVLRHLDSYNLNAYSLFATEDALMETIAERARKANSTEPAGKPGAAAEIPGPDYREPMSFWEK